MGIVEEFHEVVETTPIAVESLFICKGLKQLQNVDDDIQTIEEARTVIKQLRDRCRFQTHQALLWRKKAKMQVYKQKKSSG